MSIAKHIPVAQALLSRSRHVLHPFRNGGGTVLLGAAGIAPPKPPDIRSAAQPAFVQRHGGN